MGLHAEAGDPPMLVSLLLLAMGTALAAAGLRHHRWELPATALTTAGAIGWALTNESYNGPRLLVLTEGSGLHLGDLLAVPGLLLVLYLIYRGVRR